MIYDIYAMFMEGSYLVASSNDSNHGMDMCEKVCRRIGQQPMAISAMIRGEHVLNGNIFNLNDLNKRG